MDSSLIAKYGAENVKRTGKSYTPLCFVNIQTELLSKYYGENWQDEYIVFDPCCGSGNLEAQYNKDNCYMSTLEAEEVKECKERGFNNVVQFDYLVGLVGLKDSEPTFKYKGEELTIKEIAKKENKKLMVIMNPPYQRIKGYKNNLAIEFFNKVCKLAPETIVFYYNTENLLKETEYIIKSKYKVVNHIISNMATTFMLTNGSVSQVIFDKNKGKDIDLNDIPVDRYEYNKKLDTFDYIKTYHYNSAKPNLIKEIDKLIKKNAHGIPIGSYCYFSNVISITNLPTKNNNNKITTDNLEYVLVSRGINFNTNAKYFEHNDVVYKGSFDNIPEELKNDAKMFSLFYKNCAFSNKTNKKITTDNLEYVLVSRGINFNTDAKYFEHNDVVYKGSFDNIPEELKNDAKMFSLFYTNCAFSNKTNKNYIMPFYADELGCNKNDLNVLELKDEFDRHEGWWDFREWFHKFKYSSEALDLYYSALKIFKYYHTTFTGTEDTDFNDSWYDITNAVMNKDMSNLQLPENDTRTIARTRTTKGTVGFGRNTIKKRVPADYLPIFYNFFDKRDILAKKINKQLLEAGLLLWERENIY